MKNQWIIAISIFAALLILVYVHILFAVQKVFIKIKFTGLNLNGLNLISLIERGKTSFALRLDINVKNTNNTSIKFSDLYAEVYNNGQLVAKSSDRESNFNKITIPAKGSANIYEEMDVVLSNSMVNLLRDRMNEKSVKFDYIVKLKVFGIRIKVNNSHIIE